VAVRILSQTAELVAGNKGTILKTSRCFIVAISPASIDPYLLCYQPRPRCAATTRLPLAPVKSHGENSLLVLLRYFVIAVGAGVAASGIIGYILASMLIRRYEKADRPFKTSRGTTIQPISYLPVPSPAPTHAACIELPLDASDLNYRPTGPQAVPKIGFSTTQSCFKGHYLLRQRTLW